MHTRILLAALVAAASLGARTARAQESSMRPSEPDYAAPSSPGYDQSAPHRDQAVPSNDDRSQRIDAKKRHHRAARRHEETNGTPSRMEPSRTFPGDLPEKTTTPGSLDREGRVNQNNPANPAPDAFERGEYR
jgi:hypothetical protein